MLEMDVIMQSLCFLSVLFLSVNADVYNVGKGIADATGMAADAALYGYAKPNQDARGIHMREWSRAFIFEKDDTRAVFVVVETIMIPQAVRTGVIEKLKVLYDDLYTYDNVMITATHSHSSPGGYNTYWMYVAPTGGFVQATYDAVVNGIVQSIQNAHEDMRPANIYSHSGDLLDASASRSAYSYYHNSQEEIDRYEYDVDKEMEILKIVSSADQTPLGMISYFGVHTTSMKNWNHLVSSDNKGYSAQLFEKYVDPNSLPGKSPSFVAAFSNTMEGDSCPNTQGEYCIYSNMTEMCSYNTSTCSQDRKDPSLCLGYGPAGEMFEDTKIIGTKQYEKARELFLTAESGLLVSGPVDYRHQWVDMTNIHIGGIGNKTSCKPSMGYSFAAGASDGPGIKPFTQGMTEGLPMFEMLINQIFNRSDELIACHDPKPILLPTGEHTYPYVWQPAIMAVHLIRIGDIVLLGVPHEVTTMSGRRLREAVKQILVQNGLPLNTTKTITVGLTNGFGSYLTTYEEYQVQRYEGASTTYGPHTLEAYTLKFENLALAMATDVPVDPGTPPPDLRGLQRDVLGPLLVDLDLPGYTYGDVLQDVELEYHQGDTVEIVFLTGSPRHNLMTEQTFVEVVLRDVNGWSTVYTDASWETRFYWDSNCHSQSSGCDVEQQSNATILWEIPLDQEVGDYRIVHHGHAYLPDTLEVVSFSGISSRFRVQPSIDRREKPYYVPERYWAWRDEKSESFVKSLFIDEYDEYDEF